MLKVTTSLKGLEVLALLRVVNELAETSNVLPVDFIWEMTKTRKQLVKIAEIIEEKRIDLVKEHGTEKDGVYNIEEKSEDWHKFVNNYTSVLDSSFSVDIKKYSYTDLEDCFKQNKMATLPNIYMFFEHFIYDADEAVEDLNVDVEVPHQNGKSEKVLEKA